jgi:dipeptidyl aminopeptidase/acylaminoacyl peptidase
MAIKVLKKPIFIIPCFLILFFVGPLLQNNIRATGSEDNSSGRMLEKNPNSFQSSSLAQATPLRVLTYDDLLQLESFPSYYLNYPPYDSLAHFSPNGEELVYEFHRPKKLEQFHNMWYMDGYDRSDVLLVYDRSKTPINITKGYEDGTGFCRPLWSPDGRYLAMFSTRGPEENIYLWVWEKATGEMTLLHENACDPHGAKPVWISNSEIVFPVLPYGEIPYMYNVSNETPRIASREWHKNKYDQESTGSVLESGIRVDCLKNPKGQLIYFDVATGKSRELGKGRIIELLPSPDRKLLAGLILSSLMPLRTDRLLYWTCNERYQIRLYDENGVISSKVLSSVKTVIPGTVKWSSDGRKLVFMGNYDETEGLVDKRPAANWEVPSPYISRGPQMVFTYSPSEDKLDKVHLKNLGPVENENNYIIQFHLGWTPKNQVLVYAHSFSDVPNSEYDRQRNDWWILKKEISPVCLTKKFENPSPLHLYSEKGRNSWIYLSEGNLWRIKDEGNQVISITKNRDKKISSIIWVDKKDGTGINKLIYQVSKESGKSELYLLDLALDKTIILEKPTERAEFITFSSSNLRAVFIENNRNGTYLWLTCPIEGWIDTIVETNTFLQDINEGKTMRIDYRSLDGESFTGWILLPPDYKEGQKYPLVSWVYQGSVESKFTPNFLTQLNNSLSLNMQLLAAHGYAVLFPSMPEPAFSYHNMRRGVLPAINKAIQLGIADPERLVVMGHSLGGYTTFGLITQTNLFKTAIALAGPSDLISFYLQFEVRKRYGENPLARLYPQRYLENYLNGGNMPPWVNVQEYIRNSPIFYVQRVNTPVLIFHADIEGVNIGQAEEFYIALYRQGKRARFVRYWGDDHVITNPANVKDMWKHIINWLKENGCPPGAQ